MHRIYPQIVGHGRAGEAIHQALAVLRTQGSGIAEAEWVGRDARFKRPPDGISVAFIANPHGLHSDRILEAAREGFDGIATEKPACVTREQAAALREVKTKTAVFHGYRQMWGPQTLKQMIAAGELGKIISIEGRYWQSSTAERSIQGPSPTSWKNDVNLSGPSDTLLDVGTHWIDMAIFLADERPTHISGWRSYANSEAPHRDSHVHVILEFPNDIRGFSSITKNAHGATNHFEINVFGTKGSATWMFLNPDEILLGHGRERSIRIRETSKLGTGHPPFHGAGWLEGYVEITRQLINDITGVKGTSYPTLQESVSMVDALLASDILKR